jgi:hypothetical protein
MSLATIKPGEDGIVRLASASGVLLEVPIYENHYRGTNYLAIIEINPAMPGGLARRWVDKGRGDCLYITEKLAVFDAVEFAADYTTSVGRRNRERFYGVIVEKTETQLAIQPFPTGVKAIIAAAGARAKRDETAVKTRVSL